MNIIPYANKLKDVSHRYYNRSITHEQYRLSRKNILNALDTGLNGMSVPDEIRDNNGSDITQAYSTFTHSDLGAQDLQDATVEL